MIELKEMSGKMTYKEQIVKAMEELAKESDTLFIGQGLSVGDRVYGTFNTIPTIKCLELPTAENLAVGVAMGLCLKGFRPILVFQRMDFMLVCADAIINHMALIPRMSGGQVKFPLIIRAIIGSQDREKFDVGLQHSKDLTYVFDPWIGHTMKLGLEDDIVKSYLDEYKNPTVTGALFVEQKDLYGETSLRQV